ncbi:CAP domain-containing protein [Priestia megaterium]|uniref:CAP domain-containing protein n=1 Tax=Priestia megaterium TaxID=1404 RepID=UPI002452CC2B|nr:CAP domain-containing protein [Priestia megaterium]MDH3139401.1 CAP domain-containing protein [Priestia megaterium]MED4239180.1 CAP domain-containing protein [Priestia megaterium]MED4256229.1 CAP domain-containing protein [Priestia megaterium]MED4267510.1 CAP domain-containing protein [Priestia megaterium]MED4279758.1 CAP domain-containing protein [Priestia megaterium]
MKKRFRIATVAGAVSLGLLTAGQANAAAPDCNTPKQINIKDAQAAQNINVDELLKKFNAQEQSAQAAAPQQETQAPEQAEAAPQEQAQAPEQSEEAKAPEQTQQNTKAQQSENTDKAEQTKDASQFEQKVVDLVNQEREKQGLKPLTLNKKLSDVARTKSKDMMDKGYFDHNSPTYGSPFDMMKQFGIEYTTAGENIAKGQQSPEDVMNAWMNSDGHRKNILNPDFTEIGVGYVKGDTTYWTQQFIGK